MPVPWSPEQDPGLPPNQAPVPRWSVPRGSARPLGRKRGPSPIIVTSGCSQGLCSAIPELAGSVCLAEEPLGRPWAADSSSVPLSVWQTSGCLVFSSLHLRVFPNFLLAVCGVFTNKQHAVVNEGASSALPGVREALAASPDTAASWSFQCLHFNLRGGHGAQ